MWERIKNIKGVGGLMVYDKTEWVDGLTPVNAVRLNKIENGIYEAQKSIPTKVSQLKNDSNYIDQSKIKNTLVETITGNVLDATMGKILKDEIDKRALKTEVGVLSKLTTTVKNSIVNSINEVVGCIGKLQSLTTNVKTSLVDAINENTNKINVLSTQSILPKQDLTNSNNMLQIRTPGVYRVFNRVPSNFIPGYSEGYFSILVYENNQYCVQEATCFNTGRTFKQLINSLSGEVFKSWYEIATTDKTEILQENIFNGYSVWSNGYGDNLFAAKSGNIVCLNGLIRCGVKTKNTKILNIPQGYRPNVNIIKNVSCYPYGTATIEIQVGGNILVGNIQDSTQGISLNDLSYSIL